MIDWLKKTNITKYRIDGKSDWKGEKCGGKALFLVNMGGNYPKKSIWGEITLKRANENGEKFKKIKKLRKYFPLSGVVYVISLA